MTIQSFSVAFLMTISGILGVSSLPKEPSPDWKVETDWHQLPTGYAFKASSNSIFSTCKEHEDWYLEFPSIIHGAHELYIDHVLIERFGDTSYSTMRSFYGSLIISCKQLKYGSVLTWIGSSYSQYFSRILFWPRFIEHPSYTNVFSETMNVVAGGLLLVLSLFTFLFFWGREDNVITLLLTTADLAFAMYFIGGAGSFFGLRYSMLTCHKVADMGVWIGFALFYKAMERTGLIGNKLYNIYLINIIIGSLFVVSGQSGNQIQFGTTLPFFLTIFSNIVCEIVLLKQMINSHYSRRAVFGFLSLSLFLLTSLNEIGIVHRFIPWFYYL